MFEFDARTGGLRREGRVVKLSPQPARVLALLLSRPGDVILRDELRDHLWGGDTFVDFERGLNFCVLQVRGRSAIRRRTRGLCKRCRGRGTGSSRQLPRRADLRPHADLRPRRGLMAFALVALAAFGTWVATRAGTEVTPGTEVDGGTEVPTGAAAPTHPARIRVAVLPFVNLTGDPAADYLADSLTDEVISQLGQLGPDRLAVIARTSAMSYRNTSKTIAEIGHELNATFVVESSIRRDGRALRIASNLVPSGDQSPAAVWSETFGGDAAAG